MFEKYSRRRALKLTGSSAAAMLGLGTGVSAASPDSIGNDSQWSESARDKVEHSSEFVVSQSTSVHWFGAYMPSTRDGWRHDMAITTCAASEYQEDYWMSGSTREITGTMFDIEVNDQFSETVHPQPSPDFVGVYPKDGDNLIPGWADTLFDLTLGALHPSIAFGLGADDLVQAMTPEDGFKSRSDGVRFRYTMGLFDLVWQRTAHFNRFEFGHREAPEPGPNMWIEASTASERTDNPSVEFSIDLFATADPIRHDSVQEGGNMSEKGATGTKVRTTDPEEMTPAEQNKFGVQDVSNEGIRAPNGEKVQYIATNIPIRVTTKNTQKTDLDQIEISEGSGK